MRAQRNWLHLVWDGTVAPCSGVGSLVRGHCDDGSMALHGQDSHGGES